MSRRRVSKEENEKFGIRDNLVRISVGLEDCGDLIKDLDQALSKAVIRNINANI